MNPIKRKEISKLTAEKLGKDVAMIDEIVTFFYRHVQKKLSSMEHIAVNVPNLGTFVLKKRRVQSKLERLQHFVNVVDETQSIRAFETKQNAKKDIEKYKGALKIIETEEERKQQVRKLKKELEDDY